MKATLTAAQTRVMRALNNGGQLWPVSTAEDVTDDPNLYYVLARFDNGEFIGTERVQLRTLIRLRNLGLLKLEI